MSIEFADKLVEYVVDELINIKISQDLNKIDQNRLKTFFEFIVTKIQQLNNLGPRKNTLQEAQLIVLITARDDILHDIKLKRILGITD